MELLKKGQKSTLSKEDDSELRKYSCMLFGHLDWEARDHYLELLEDFRNEKIEASNFCSDFVTRGLLNNDVSDILESNLILLSPDEKSFGFSDLIDKIDNRCFWEFQDPELYDKDREIEFKNFIEKIYFQIQKYLDE